MGACGRTSATFFASWPGQKESRIEDGHLRVDHVHMMIAIPPRYAVSQVIGYIEGESAIHLARVYGERRRNYEGRHFWARGYFVSTVGPTLHIAQCRHLCAALVGSPCVQGGLVLHFNPAAVARTPA